MMEVTHHTLEEIAEQVRQLAGQLQMAGRKDLLVFLDIMDEYAASYYIISGHTQKHVAGSSRVWYERLKVITLPRELVINETEII